MPSTEPTTSGRKLPGPVYAAAGAGELALEQLRKLPGQLGELRERAKLNERIQTARADLMEAGRKVRELDSDRLRDAAVKAQERARETYDELVTRGERVAAGERSPIRVTARVSRAESAPAAPAAPAGTATRKRAPRTAKK